MKTNSIDEKSIKKVLPFIGGGLGGIMVGKAAMSMFYKPALPTAPTADELKKKTYFNLALMAGGTVLAIVADSSTSLGAALQGAGIAMAATNGTDALSGALASSPTISAKITNTTAKAALGLSNPNCGCGSQRVIPANVAMYSPQLNGYKKGIRTPEYPVLNNDNFTPAISAGINF